MGVAFISDTVTAASVDGLTRLFFIELGVTQSG